jgi:hypothetical protein
MISVGAVSSSSVIAAGNPLRRDASTPREPKVSASRALIPLTPVAPSETPDRTRVRADAGFLAHLIATDQKMPQTRERRRAEPAVAIAAYTAANAAPATLIEARVLSVM